MHTLKSIEIRGFRGQSSPIIIHLDRSTNFIIGRNGTGKTTLINLIKALLTADVPALRSSRFQSAEIKFKDTNSNRVPRLSIRVVDEPNVLESITYEYRDTSTASPEIYEVYLRQARKVRISNQRLIRTIFDNDHNREFQGQRDLTQILNKLINISWLSLHRKDVELYSEEYEEWEEERSYKSAVDEKLTQVFGDISQYFFRLDARVSGRLRDFQKESFLSFMTSDARTDISLINDIDPDEEKEALALIFEQFEVDRKKVSAELRNQFKRFEEVRTDFMERKVTGLKNIAVLVDTLRLHYLVGRWQSLQAVQNSITAPKRHFSDVCSTLLFRKSLEVDDENDISIVDNKTSLPIPIDQLSSGEKQLLIFLGETLLQENSPHIFLADEPELSLHIEWQEKLVANILELNPNAQIVFATHSPDIVSSFRDSVIKMEHIAR